MGFSLPAAIGCKVGVLDKIVVDIDDDASLSMTAMELATMVQHNIGVKCLVLNNGVQGMVNQWQGEPHIHDSASQLCLSTLFRPFLQLTILTHRDVEPQFCNACQVDACACYTC